MIESGGAGRLSHRRKEIIRSMPIAFTPIGFVENPAAEVPRHWTVPDLEGTLVLQPEYMAGYDTVYFFIGTQYAICMGE